MGLSKYDPGQELASIDFSSLIGGPLNAIVDSQAKAALSTVDFVKSVGFSPDTEDEATGEVKPGEPVYISFKYPKLVKPYQPGIKGKLEKIEADRGDESAVTGSGYQVGDVLDLEGVVFVTVTEVGGSGEIKKVSFDSNLGGGYDSQDDVSATGGSGAEATFDITTVDIPAENAVFEEMRLEVPILTMMPIPFIRVEEGEINFNAKITSMEYKRIGTKFKTDLGFSMKNKNTNKNWLFLGGLSNNNENVNTIKLKTSLSYQRDTRQGHKINKTYHMGVKIKVGQEEMPEGAERLLGILEDAIVSQPIE